MKKVVRMEKKLKTNELTFFFEDNDIRFYKLRHLNKEKIEVGYFKKWLLSLGNKRALAFERSIDANHRKLLDLKAKIFEINPQLLQVLLLTDIDSTVYNTRHYIEKLDTNTRKWIKSNFYKKRLSEVCLESGDTILKQMTFSENLQKAINSSKSADCNSNFLDFVDRVRMCNYISEWTNVMNTKSPGWYFTGVSKPKFYSKDSVRLINENNSYLKSSIGLYKELYILRGKLYSKTYGVFFVERV